MNLVIHIVFIPHGIKPHPGFILISIMHGTADIQTKLYNIRWGGACVNIE